MSKLSPEETYDHALVTITKLATDFHLLIRRANDNLPGPGAANAGAGDGGFNIDAMPEADGAEERDDAGPMSREERRAIQGADAAERDVALTIADLLEIQRRAENIEKRMACYRPQHRLHDPDDVPFDWCPNCYRQCQHHTPTERRKKPGDAPGQQSGDKIYAQGWCGPCGRWHAAHGWLPTRKLLMMRYAGQTPTMTVIDAEERKLPKALKPKGTRRKGRSPLFTSSSP